MKTKEEEQIFVNVYVNVTLKVLAIGYSKITIVDEDGNGTWVRQFMLPFLSINVTPSNKKD